MTLFLHGYALRELQSWLVEHGEKPFRAKQIFHWLYQKKESDWDKMTDLSPAFKELLRSSFSLQSLRLHTVQHSTDGETIKFLWELADGKLVESVLIVSPDRRTVCVSSQVGCPARCAFCASGQEGFVRNLSAVEIFEQVYQIDAWLHRGLREGAVGPERVSHVVFMGMGEPFENYENVLQAIFLLNQEERLHISQRRITVSTVGVVEAIERFAEARLQVHLVLSLHAPNQHIRKKIIPYARKYELDVVLRAMLEFAAKTQRNITYEYTLIEGVNDLPEHAEELAQLVQNHPCTVNLIPYNPVPGIRLRRPEKEVIVEFRRILDSKGIVTTWRYTKGKDIAAACGQLALQVRENIG